MKKLWKAVAGLVAAAAMLLTGGIVATSASADDGLRLFAAGEDAYYRVSIENTVPGYVYEAYQIFAGDVYVNKDGKKVLSNIKWGSGVDGSKQNALLEMYRVANVSDLADKLTEDTAKDFAQTVSNCLSETKTESMFAESSSENDSPSAHYVIPYLRAGYYLIKNSVVPEGGSHTEYMLQVVGDVSTTPKANAPTMVKKVMDANDTTNEMSGWQDSADYDIGDEVPFHLSATLPFNYTSYKTYSLRFHDVMSEGLTFDKDSVKVYAVDGENRDELSPDAYQVITVPDRRLPDGETFNVLIDWNVNLLNAEEKDQKPGETADEDSGVKFVVEYTAILNEHANLGATGNLNEAWLEFSNNPNDGNENSFEATPKDRVRVFTYELVVNKTDGEKPLAGAAFMLEKKIGDYSAQGYHWAQVKTVDAGDDVTSFDFVGLDDGDYRLTETTTPDGYNTIEPIEFTIVATHDTEADEPQLRSFTVNGFGKEISNHLGVANVNVVNKAGSDLPSTGGMGTTVLYVVGAAIAIAAALGLTLVLRKRQNAR